MLALLAGPAAAQSSFSHNDWDVVCDNTHTCRAVGYHCEDCAGGTADFSPQAVSVLLTRKAGPNTPFTAQLTVQNTATELSFTINGGVLAELQLDDDLQATLPPPAASALVRALTGSTTIAFEHNGVFHRLSDSGSTAALLFMDEYQGRVGAKDAAVRPGDRAATKAKPAALAPLVTPVSWQPLSPEDQSAHAMAAGDIRQAVVRRMADQDCNRFEDALAQGAVEITLYAINSSYVLATTPCWLAAYNGASAAFLVPVAAPDELDLISLNITDVVDETLITAMKSRGLGDCWSGSEMVWIGHGFALQSEWTTGPQCRGFAGGAWVLPHFVTRAK